MGNNLTEDLQELRNEQDAAEEARAFFLFFKQHPELNCIANEKLLKDYITPMDVTFDALEFSLDSVRNRLAIKTPQKTAETLKAAVDTENERLKNLSVSELRTMVSALRPKERVIELPPEFDRAKIKAMTALEMRALVTRFGSDAVTRGLNR